MTAPRKSPEQMLQAEADDLSEDEVALLRTWMRLYDRGLLEDPPRVRELLKRRTDPRKN